mgnify:CR=1 FL=1
MCLNQELNWRKNFHEELKNDEVKTAAIWSSVRWSDKEKVEEQKQLKQTDVAEWLSKRNKNDSAKEVYDSDISPYEMEEPLDIPVEVEGGESDKEEKKEEEDKSESDDEEEVKPIDRSPERKQQYVK